MNLLLLLAHSIEEHDQLRLLAGLGYDVFSIGGYVDPNHPHDPKRPALPQVPFHPELKNVIDKLGTDNNLEAAKQHIPDELLDWADVIICHHYEWKWLWPQWDRIKHKRVIWRTVGQSTTANEHNAAQFRRDGLQIVRYSPKEAAIPEYAGADALIRFYKDPEEWKGWVGDEDIVINITQHLMQRGDSTNYLFWDLATHGLPSKALGPGSTAIGGPGELTLLEMQKYLQLARAYLYTGTQPASYTLGFIEAMMTGIPIVSIGSSWMRMLPYGPALFEASELALLGYDDPAQARSVLIDLLSDRTYNRTISVLQREKAIAYFGMDKIGKEWKAFLG